MAYLRQHRRPEEKRRRIIAGVVVAVAVVIGLIQLLAPQVLPAFANAIARPFWREQFYAKSGAFRSTAELLAENESLKRQLSDLRAGIASSSIALLQSENPDLLVVMTRSTTTPRHFVLGAVLARPSFLPYDEFIIDVGSSDGIATTSQVYTPEKILVGHILGLQGHSAKVALYSSPRETYNVSIGPSHIPATAVGQGGGQYRASVPHGSNIQIGDFVSDNALYDRPFGVVVSIITDPSDPFDTVLFAPPVNIYQTRFVLVDTGKAAPAESAHR